MNWSSPLRARDGCLTPRSRIFLYLGLAATLLLLSYQLILYSPTPEETIGVVVIGDKNDFPDPEPESEPVPTSEPAPELVPTPSSPEPSPEPTPAKELVFAAMEASNMSWVDENLSDWTANIYRADAGQGLTVPINKGNEAMVYLTYVALRFCLIFKYPNPPLTPISNQLHHRSVLVASRRVDLPAWQPIPMARRQPAIRLRDIDPGSEGRFRSGSWVCEHAVRLERRMSQGTRAGSVSA